MSDYSLDQALAARAALREAAGMREERFDTEAFVGMVSDEIEAARDQGLDNASIAELIARSSGIRITADDLARFYAPPEARRRG